LGLVWTAIGTSTQPALAPHNPGTEISLPLLPFTFNDDPLDVSTFRSTNVLRNDMYSYVLSGNDVQYNEHDGLDLRPRGTLPSALI
jgi:hypothetical protein